MPQLLAQEPDGLLPTKQHLQQSSFSTALKRSACFPPHNGQETAFCVVFIFALHQVAELVVQRKRQDCTAEEGLDHLWCQQHPWEQLKLHVELKGKAESGLVPTDRAAPTSNNCYGQTGRRAFTNHPGRARNP